MRLLLLCWGAKAAGRWLGLRRCVGVSWHCFASRCVWCVRCLCFELLGSVPGAPACLPLRLVRAAVAIPSSSDSATTGSSRCSSSSSTAGLPTAGPPLFTRASSSIAAPLWRSNARRKTTAPARLAMVVRGGSKERSFTVGSGRLLELSCLSSVCTVGLLFLPSCPELLH